MSNEQIAPLPTGVARAALVAGILSVVLVVLYFTTSAGAFTLFACIAAGLVGVVLGIVALRKRQFVGVSVAGLVMSAIGFLIGVAILVFALIFVGAFG